MQSDSDLDSEPDPTFEDDDSEIEEEDAFNADDKKKFGGWFDDESGGGTDDNANDSDAAAAADQSSSEAELDLNSDEEVEEVDLNSDEDGAGGASGSNDEDTDEDNDDMRTAEDWLQGDDEDEDVGSLEVEDDDTVIDDKSHACATPLCPHLLCQSVPHTRRSLPCQRPGDIQCHKRLVAHSLHACVQTIRTAHSRGSIPDRVGTGVSQTPITRPGKYTCRQVFITEPLSPVLPYICFYIR